MWVIIFIILFFTVLYLSITREQVSTLSIYFTLGILVCNYAYISSCGSCKAKIFWEEDSLQYSLWYTFWWLKVKFGKKI